MPLRLGTRASALARWQADWVAGELRASGVEVELVPITTSGDVKRGSIAEIGGQGLFTKEIQRALLEGRIDLAVHSLKDLPTEPVPGLHLAAVPPRAPIGDVLVCREPSTLGGLAQGAVVGTGSLRRRAQLLHARPDLQVQDLRGNVDTRLAKLDRGEYDAVILAEAGLRRLGFDERITHVLPESIMLPAVGQGALGLETRTDDRGTNDAVNRLNDRASQSAVVAERSMLAALKGGCLAPIAARGRAEATQLRLTGRVIAADGSRMLEAEQTATADAAEQLGRAVAEELLAAGAAELIAAARRSA
jgi:hydroxymethylbilane synthase